MIINKLIIRKLHDVYNYEVDFNEDLTFLYGINGSGKTTILNIVTSIVTGNINELFKYNFESITLNYANTNNEKNFIAITSKTTNGMNEFQITYKDKKHTFDFNKFEIEEEIFYKKGHRFNRNFYEGYPFLQEIKKEFSYIYLPLNRNESYIKNDSGKYRHLGIDEKENNPNPMQQVESLVKDKVLKINNEVNKLNDNFRNQILTSTLNTYKNSLDVKTIFKQIFDLTDEKIEKIQSSYISILANLDLLNSADKIRYEKFFNDYKDSVTSLSKGMGEEADTINLIIQYNEISKIRNIVTLAKKMEAAKRKEFLPLEIFRKTVNDFLKADTVENKEIFIDDKGAIRFHTKASNNTDGLSIEKLSSGEKQLLIFFATLIFRVNNNQSNKSIFIVDEPELSLHLAWQYIFVEKVLAINNNIQLIFATHSPEIIGSYRNKTNELKKELDGVIW